MVGQRGRDGHGVDVVIGEGLVGVDGLEEEPVPVLRVAAVQDALAHPAGVVITGSPVDYDLEPALFLTRRSCRVIHQKCQSGIVVLQVDLTSDRISVAFEATGIDGRHPPLHAEAARVAIPDVARVPQAGGQPHEDVDVAEVVLVAEVEVVLHVNALGERTVQLGVIQPDRVHEGALVGGRGAGLVDDGDLTEHGAADDDNLLEVVHGVDHGQDVGLVLRIGLEQVSSVPERNRRVATELNLDVLQLAGGLFLDG